MDKLIRWIILAPGFWLIYHIFMIGYSSDSIRDKATGGFVFLSQIGALDEFKMYRNDLYLAYAAVCIAAGIVVHFSNNAKQQQLMRGAIPTIIQAILLTTFSYAIAGILLDISYLIG